jgi:hypothetical protein
MDDRGSIPSRDNDGNFSVTASRPTLGPTQPPTQWVLGDLTLGVKRPGREADHSPPTSFEVKNAWSYTSTSPVRLMTWCLVNHRKKCIFLTFTLHCLNFRHNLLTLSAAAVFSEPLTVSGMPVLNTLL